MKVSLLILPVLLSLQNGTDKHYPRGCYMSFAEIKNKMPGIGCNLKIEKRGEDAKLWLGGNDFKMVPADKCISKAKIQNQVWAYSNDTVLFVNCRLLNIQSRDEPATNSYSQVLTYGRYLAFYSYYLSQEVKIAGALGGAVGTAIAAGNSKEPLKKELHVIDMQTAKLFWVDSAFIAKTLEGLPELYGKFTQKEMFANDAEVQLNYLKLVNNARP